MKRLRLTISDLLEALRIGGSPSLSSVEYAVMESNGNLSIIQKAQEKPLTLQIFLLQSHLNPCRSLDQRRELLPSEPASLRMDGTHDGQRAFWHAASPVAVEVFSRSVMNRVAFTYS